MSKGNWFCNYYKSLCIQLEKAKKNHKHITEINVSGNYFGIISARMVIVTLHHVVFLKKTSDPKLLLMKNYSEITILQNFEFFTRTSLKKSFFPGDLEGTKSLKDHKKWLSENCFRSNFVSDGNEWRLVILGPRQEAKRTHKAKNRTNNTKEFSEQFERGPVITQWNKGFGANRTRKFTRTFGNVRQNLFHTVSLGTFSVPH